MSGFTATMMISVTEFLSAFPEPESAVVFLKSCILIGLAGLIVKLFSQQMSA